MFTRSLCLLCCAALISGQAQAPLPDHHVNQLKVTILSTMLADQGIGEWGFAALVEADGRQLLVDTGARPETVLSNLRGLKIDLSGVRDVVLTHFHSDHTGGLMTLRTEMKKRNEAALSLVHGATGLFYSRPLPDGGEANPMIAMRSQYEATGGQFVEHDHAAEILPGVWLTGPVARKFPERNWSGSGKVRTQRHGGRHDTRGSIGSGEHCPGPSGDHCCGHAGIVNILTAANTQFARQAVYAVIGGLHLYAAKDEQVDWTGGQLKRLGVRYLMGAHCTGIESLYRLRGRIGLTRQTAVVGAVGADFTLGNGIHPGRVAQ